MDAASRAGYGDPEPNKSFKTYDRKRAQEAVDDGYTIDTRVERSGKRAYSTRSVYVNEEKRQGILRRKKQVVDYSRARFHRGGGFVDHGVNKSLAMPNTVSSTGDVAKSSQSAAVKNARLMLVAKGTVIQGPWDKPRPKGVRAAAGRLAKPRNLAEAALIGVAGGLVVNAASKLAAEYKRNPDEFKQTFRDQAARDRENKARWKANKTPMRQRIREVREQNSRPATTVGKSMPNTMAATGDVAKSNMGRGRLTRRPYSTGLRRPSPSRCSRSHR